MQIVQLKAKGWAWLYGSGLGHDGVNYIAQAVTGLGSAYYFRIVGGQAKAIHLSRNNRPRRTGGVIRPFNGGCRAYATTYNVIFNRSRVRVQQYQLPWMAKFFFRKPVQTSRGRTGTDYLFRSKRFEVQVDMATSLVSLRYRDGELIRTYDLAGVEGSKQVIKLLHPCIAPDELTFAVSSVSSGFVYIFDLDS